jgi:hypothetical protein
LTLQLLFRVSIGFSFGVGSWSRFFSICLRRLRLVETGCGIGFFASGTTATGGFATTGAGVGFTLASAIAFALAAASAAIFLFF